MLRIKAPYIEDRENKSRLIFDINIDDKENKKVFFEVDKEWKKYLCYERSDAILIGLLNWAMRTNHDIELEAPVTEELLYNINVYLIPSLTNYDKNLYKIKIFAKTIIEPIHNAGGVGTGISCGVDSFHSIYNNYNSQYDGMALTHLCINSVGSFHSWYKEYGIEKTRDEVYARAQKVSDELGLPLIKSLSNIKEEFNVNFDFIHTYCSMFAVYCMQKLWKVYYYGSHGYDFNHFNLSNNSKKASGYYELLSLPCFSTHSLHLYSEGGTKDRLEKTKNIVDNELTQKYLHVCCTQGVNCGVCMKCKRTLLTLDALGKIDKYDKVFNIEYYKNHRKEYLDWLYSQYQKNDPMLKAVYKILKKDISIIIKIKYWYMYFFKKILSLSKKQEKLIIYILFIKISLKLREKR